MIELLDAPPEAKPTPQWRPRERQALEELGTTWFSRGVPLLLLLVFGLTIVTVPIAETIGDYRLNVATRDSLIAAHAPKSEIPGRRPRVFGLIQMLPTPRRVRSARSFDDWRRLLPSAEQLRDFEDDLSLSSTVGRAVRPWVQWALTGWLGTGSQKVLIGRDGWLYYSDGVDYVTGPGFLTPERLQANRRTGFVADPRPAILQLSTELKAEGVTLILVPVPDKTIIRPTSLGGLSQDAPVQNASWEQFTAFLRANGIEYVDLTPEMINAERSGIPQFLRGDSHWSPAGIDLAARAVSQRIAAAMGGQAPSLQRYHRRPATVNWRNDLVGLLDLPTSHAESLGLHEIVSFDQVVDRSGSVWKSDSSSDVLFFGDSYMEVFSLGDVGGGLADQASYYLQHPIERRADHIFGRFDTRKLLGTSIDEVRRSATGRRVIVWEFAMRKLTVSTWPLLP